MVSYNKCLQFAAICTKVSVITFDFALITFTIIFTYSSISKSRGKLCVRASLVYSHVIFAVESTCFVFCEALLLLKNLIFKNPILGIATPTI